MTTQTNVQHTPIQLRHDKNGNVEIMFRGKWHGIHTRWAGSEEAQEPNKDFRALTDRAWPLMVSAPALLEALEALTDRLEAWSEGEHRSAQYAPNADALARTENRAVNYAELAALARKAIALAKGVQDAN